MRVHEFIIQGDLDREDMIRICTDASRFAARITLQYRDENGERIVDVKSLLGMILIAIPAGTSARLITVGMDDLEALEYLLPEFEGHAEMYV